MSIKNVESPPVIVAHVHVFKKNMPLMPNPRHAPDYDFTQDDLQKILDAHGVQRCVIAAASPWGDCNDYVIETLRNKPQWRGTVILNPSITNRYELDSMAKDGVVGVRLPFISMKELPDIQSFDYRKFLYRLCELDWHVHLHLDGPRIPAVLPHLEKSGVKVVVDHLARPDPVKGINCEGFQAVLKSIEKGRTWVKLSAGYRLGNDSVEYAKAFCERANMDRLVWASDCPFVGVESTTYQSTIDWLMQVEPDPLLRYRIHTVNPLALYF